MKPKKWLALFLAAALTISAASPSSMTVMASEQTAESKEAESVEEPEEKVEAEEVAELEEQPEVEETTEPEEQPKVKETTEPEEQPEVTETTEPEEQPEVEETAEPEEQPEVTETTEPEEKTEVEEVIESEETTEENVTVEDEIEGQPAVQSLLPLEEKKVYLSLINYTESELQSMPIRTILGLLRNYDGTAVDISEDAVIAWDSTYELPGEPRSAWAGDFQVVDRDTTVNVWCQVDLSEYIAHMIVGKGNQLDSDAIRYEITVYLPKIWEQVQYSLYTADEKHEEVTGENISEKWNSESSIDGIDATDSNGVYAASSAVVFNSANYQSGKEYDLKMSLSQTERPDLQVEVYTLEEYQKLQAGQSAVAITDQILNGNGYRANYDSEQIFVVVYKKKDTGATIGQFSAHYRAMGRNVISTYTFTGRLYVYDGQQVITVADKDEGSDDVDASVLYKTTDAETTKYSHGHYDLYKGYAADGKYYFQAELTDENGNNVSDHIVKIVEGNYSSLPEAEGQKDIKTELLNTQTIPGGYELKLKKNIDEDINADTSFCAFLDDGSVWKIYIGLKEYETYGNVFKISGARQEDRTFKSGENAYVLADSKYNGNSKGNWSDLDTYMENGYQTIFLNDKDVDLSKLQPYFTTDASNKVYAGPQQESGVSVKDFSNGAVQYTTISDKYDAKNYWVTFVKKATGPKLFVNGPGERDVLLGAEWDYHDILIANVGDAVLTGLKVELNATHLKLDDYWTVGGEGNDTLAAFTTVDVGDKKYGELANLAKIRLEPDGTGRIEGTLTVSADGQEPVTIKLKGYASGADFTTEVLDDAVKYVPYSFLISNSNMYDWNAVSYKLVSGKLPAGVSFNEQTGEIYGTPTETGEFSISIQLETKNEETGDQTETHTADYVLVVGDNSNESVYKSSDPGYELLQAIGEDTNGNYDFVVRSWDDQLFVSRGELNEFVDLWLNGEKLIDGTDYTKVRGSTRITVRSQTFKNKAKREGTNTIAAEFRVNGDRNGELKRTAQNFRLDIREDNTSGNNNGSNTGNGGKKHSSSGSGSGSSSDNAVSTAATAAGVTVFDGVKFVARVMDSNNQPMANATVELHSTPQTALTNAGGYATFNPVEFGTHTFIVKDSARNVLATKEFELQEGNSVVINGSKLTAKNGSTVALSLKAENGELTFISAVATGDHEQPMVWMVMLLSCLVILGVVGYRKRNMWFKRQ